MIVYRIEFGCSFIGLSGKWQTKSGPYVNRSPSVETSEWLDQFGLDPNICISQDDKRHPAPWNDGRLVLSLQKDGFDTDCRQFNYGFQSLPRLSRWFDKYDREYMYYKGFVCMVYEVDKLYPGKTQCVFDITTAKIVGMISLKEIY